jgi:tRNA (guanine-N7-)-methyltransferase
MEACTSVWIRDPEARRGNWRALMPEAEALHLEIGCGKGKFTAEMAALHPKVLFLAVERVREALVLAMEKAVNMGLKNVFFLAVDAANLEQYFAPGEVDRIYLNFCDPWPRSKNAKRRLTYHTFLEKYRTVLRPGGEIHFKTDNAGLFAWSLEEFERYGYPVKNVTDDLHRDGIVGVMTGYEEKFHALGTPIHRCEILMPPGGPPAGETNE